jgi:hypothetical protein
VAGEAVACHLPACCHRVGAGRRWAPPASGSRQAGVGMEMARRSGRIRRRRDAREEDDNGEFSLSVGSSVRWPSLQAPLLGQNRAKRLSAWA